MFKNLGWNDGFKLPTSLDLFGVFCLDREGTGVGVSQMILGVFRRLKFSVALEQNTLAPEFGFCSRGFKPPPLFDRQIAGLL